MADLLLVESDLATRVLIAKGRECLSEPRFTSTVFSSVSHEKSYMNSSKKCNYGCKSIQEKYLSPIKTS